MKKPGTLRVRVSPLEYANFSTKNVSESQENSFGVSLAHELSGLGRCMRASPTVGYGARKGRAPNPNLHVAAGPGSKVARRQFRKSYNPSHAILPRSTQATYILTQHTDRKLVR